MTANTSHPTALHLNWGTIGFTLCLLIPSTEVVQKYFGNAGLVIYLLVASLGVWVGYKTILARLAPRITDRQVFWMTVITFLILLAALLVLYPIANSGSWGGGSDNDEAVNLATTELLKGHYPYHVKTYLGQVPSIMPGALVLAVPFVLLGNGTYQSFFWLFAFLLGMSSYLKDRRQALWLLWVMLVLSPIVLQQYVTGSDLLANSIYVLLFIIWMVEAVAREGLSAWKKTLLAVLLGVGLASRSNFLLLVPLVFSALVRRAGWKSAIRYSAITCLTLGLLIIPFYMYDPQGFYPLQTNDRLRELGIILPVATAIISLVLTTLQANSSLPGLLRNCAIVMAFPILSMMVYRSFISGYPDLDFAHYGLPFLFLGTAAFFPLLNKVNPTAKANPPIAAV
jgi:hypothetical protein